MGDTLLAFAVLETLTDKPLLDLLLTILVARITIPTVRIAAPEPMRGSFMDSRRLGAACVMSMVEGTLLATNVVWFSSIFFSSNFFSSISILWCVRWTSFDSPDLRVLAPQLTFSELRE